ncbi:MULTISPECIES: beta-ketoacyl-[acyl-carrier-protein] synthase family protein [unclassified Streptomyces]|uniref:beta-ketoacyl-[acyl-carrier-protein] synthase family protein n=1 Tax=unclassified Streptomyces TaxID=2593676 RepID=UPI0033C1358D
MSASQRVVVTGFGVFTAFGFGEQALLDGPFAGRHAFRGVKRFDTTPFRCASAAVYEGDGPQIPGVDFTDDAPPRQHDVLLACSRAAIGMAGIAPSRISGALVGSQGDYRPISRYWRSVEGAAERPEASFLPDSVPGQLAHGLAGALGLGPLRLTFTNACVASADTIVHASRLISRGRADALLCGGAYLVERELFAKFDSARAFAKDGRIRPFSHDRTGLLLGDGVACLVLESEASALARGAEVLARVAGWGIASDAYHASRPHPEGRGTAQAMESALRIAGLGPDAVDYVNVHGTGTPSNDTSETAALRRVFGERAVHVPASSTKSTTGHTLEGAGAVESVITLLALRHQLLPPTANFSLPDPECDLDYVTEGARRSSIGRALTTNSAFGGVNTALLWERA